MIQISRQNLQAVIISAVTEGGLYVHILDNGGIEVSHANAEYIKFAGRNPIATIKTEGIEDTEDYTEENADWDYIDNFSHPEVEII